MTNGGPESSPTKNQRREAAREKAKELRTAQRKRDIRNKIFLQGGLVLVIVAVVAGIAFVITSAIRPPTAGPSNMASNGIVVGQQLKAVQTSAIPAGSDPVPTKIDANVPNIRIYVDYLCPICGEFEAANAEQLGTWAENGTATVEYHPIAILTGRSAGTQYSLRAANAAACVANYSPDSFFVFNTMLFDDQPEEGTEGHSDKELSSMAKTALNSGDESSSGGAVKSVSNCIDDGTFKNWVQEATDRATTQPVPNSKLEKVKGTPTVLVNDKQYTGSITDPKEFQAFVLSVASETYAQSSATPTPTPTEVPAG
jgi:protein-disulfide isomerase